MESDVVVGKITTFNNNKKFGKGQCYYAVLLLKLLRWETALTFDEKEMEQFLSILAWSYNVSVFKQEHSIV